MRLIDADALMPNAEYKGRYDVVTAYDIANAPTIEPERKKGKWVKDNYGNTVCSKCLGMRRDNRINHINFCNQCGADMRDKEDEISY